MITARIVAWVLVALGSLGVRPGPAPAPEPLPASVRTEHFVLEIVTADGPVLEAPATETEEIGLAVLRKRREGDRLLLEWELRFRESGASDTRVHHVESFEHGRRKLVWREFRPGRGRTLFVEEEPESWARVVGPDDAGSIEASGPRADAAVAMRSIEWGGPEGLRDELTAPEGGLFPLDLIERARAASVREGTFERFATLERRFETVTLTTRLRAAARPASFGSEEGRGAEAALTRTVEVRREDGSLTGAYRFSGAQLDMFQWQAGSARGRRIPAEAWRRRAARLDEADRPSQH